jgi:hypothetical protein
MTYISRELTHFAGKGKSPDEQFQVLLKILSDGKLMHPEIQESNRQKEEGPPKEITARKSVPEDVPSMSLRMKDRISSNEKYLANVVCFCDIPREEFQIQMTKYSQFGLSFPKGFLVAKGAYPVFYIERNAQVNSGQIIADRFDLEIEELYSLFGQFNSENPEKDTISDRLTSRDSFRISGFLEFYIFSFCKFFDSSLDPEHEDNTYYEREWRAYKAVAFALTDISYVVVPEGYKDQLLVKFPDLRGRVVTAEHCKP